MSDPISRNQIYSYVKTIINPYGKPFKGTAYEFGLKVMDYIENATPVEAAPAVRGEWKPVERVLERLEELRMKEYDASDEELELRDVEDWFDEGESSGRFKAYGEAIEIIKEEFGCES